MRRAKRRIKRKGGKRRLFVFVLLLALAGLVGGFLSFANHVDGLATETASVPAADGVVVWTGRGGGRVERAGALLEAGRGERLLVSGVNESLDADAVAALAGLSEDTATCCLDIDYAALDTRGNARETAAWASALGYEHIVLVTSAYHMPRARVELGHTAQGLRVTPVAVTGDGERWWQDRARFQRLLGEYGKYLVSLARGRSGAREDLPERPLPEATTP